jgi:two-component system sensor histidine kinase BaeS
MRRRSLKTRLTLSHALVTLAGLTLLSAALLALVYRSQRAATIANLTAQAQVYAAFAAEIAPDADALAGIAPSLIRRFSPPADTVLRVLAPNGTVLYASRDLGSFPSAAALPLLTNPLPIQPVALEQGRRFVARPVQRGDQTIGVIELSQAVEREKTLLKQLALALAPSVLLALTGAAIVGYVLAGGLVRPLRRLERVAAAIASGDPQARSDDRSADEIGQVATRLNKMADELQAQLAEVERLATARQEFYRAVSHELRTPLTAIRGTAENLEDEVSPEQQVALALIQTEAARLQRLVEELLNPRDSTPAPLRRRQPIDLSALVDEVGQIMRPRAERSGIQLTVSAAPQLSVAGDRDRLKQALLNLLDNAVTWTQPGGTVMLQAEGEDRCARVQVHDSGPGIAPELRARVWERGVSANGGQGLGLALVREVVTAHGGSAHILDGDGATIEVRLPLT